MGSSIFVGRGTHLILPRYRLLAARIICSDKYRIERLAGILDVEEREAEKLLHQIDHEQRAFFKKFFGKKDASPYEFECPSGTITAKLVKVGTISQLD